MHDMREVCLRPAGGWYGYLKGTLQINETREDARGGLGGWEHIHSWVGTGVPCQDGIERQTFIPEEKSIKLPVYPARLIWQEWPPWANRVFLKKLKRAQRA